MATSLVIKNDSVVPCTPVSLSVGCDPDRETNYALSLPPQELVFSRNDSEAVSNFLISIDLPLWMGCVKLHPNLVDGPVVSSGPFLIRFIDILPDGSEGAVIETYYDAHVSSTAYAASVRLVPQSGNVPLTGVLDSFVGCKFVAVLTNPIKLTATEGFEICQALFLSQLERVCGSGAVCATVAPAITATQDLTNSSIFYLGLENIPLAHPATVWAWTSSGGAILSPPDTGAPVLEVPAGAADGDTFDLRVTVGFTSTNGSSYTLVKTLVYHVA